MTNRWLAIANLENWNIIKKSQIWGATERHRKEIRKTQIRDTVIIYVSSTGNGKKRTEVVVTGAFEISSGPYFDETQIFSPPPQNSNEVYPFRINLKRIKIFKSPVEFKPLINQLKFIKNKKMWSGHIRGRSLRLIPEEDYQLIISASTN